VKSKKSHFDADNLSSLIQSDLKTLQNDTDTFSNALIAIASADTKDQANAAKAKIDSDFQSAIDAFSS